MYKQSHLRLKLSSTNRFCCLSQEAWAKEFIATATVIENVGEPVLRLLDKLEAHGVQLSGGLLRSVFEGLAVPEDQAKVVRQLENRQVKLTASILKETAAQIRDDRMWSWLLMHPQLGEDRVHPSRSM